MYEAMAPILKRRWKITAVGCAVCRRMSWTTPLAVDRAVVSSSGGGKVLASPLVVEVVGSFSLRN